MSKVHLIQLDIKWRDKAANFERVLALVASAEITPGDLIVLPEMFATGFDVEHGALSEGQNGQLQETDEFLIHLAQSKKCFVQGSGISKDLVEKKRQNMVRVFNPQGECVLSYQKVHPFTFGGEHKRFASGNSVGVFDWNQIKVAPVICYDLRFPELFRKAVDQGAELFTVVANWPKPRHFHWKPLLQARAIENLAYVLGVNRCGADRFLSYEGGSVVFDEYGRELKSLDKEEAVLSCEVSRESIIRWREQFPALKDRKL